MRIEELRRAKDQRPFQPFAIRTADGREITIAHPDAVAWDPGERPRTLVCIQPGGAWDVVDVALVTSLGMQAPVSLIPDKGK
jgi:hypothetical protein